MIIEEKQYLMHYGILRKSGRYPWGSGADAAQRSKDFFTTVGDLRKKGLTDTEIARGLGMTSTEFRNVSSIAKNTKRAADMAQVERMKDRGMSNVAIGERLGIPEATVRSLQAKGLKEKLATLNNTADVLQKAVDDKKYIDIGSGVEHHLGVSRQKLDASLSVLKDKGYEVHTVKVDQLGTGHQTEFKVLVRPGVTQKELWQNRGDIAQVQNFTEDGGRTFLGIHPPLNVNSKRVEVVYGPDGGAKADGVIYVRPGVKDVSIGSARYAQVRIAVDGSHYLKGMAVYKDDLPAGVDLQFNTNKKDTGNKLDAMKAMKDDPDNPFGAVVRQRVERDEHGKEFVTSAMNIVGSKPGAGEEGAWGEWSKTLSSQFLSKQEPRLAKQQLDMAYESKKAELDGIKGLTNPAVKKVLLEKFADGADSSAVHLKAAALPGQSTHVILPLKTIKETEVYAPNYNNGDRVVLVRHPHGGIFELPELVVNNRNPEGVKTIGTGPKSDAVGIHHKVAEKLSGADFDGDTVLVIPNNKGQVKTAPALKQLIGFDPKDRYPAYEGMKPMTSRQTQTEMGKISNLITDMTLKGAKQEELARAVKHSMVVIDAEKHKLNYRQSAIDNGISQLKATYQNGAQSGAATLISRKGQEDVVLARKARSAAQGGGIDKATGQKMYENTNESYVSRTTGERIFKTEKVKKILNVDDVNSLTSGTTMEKLYADHSNRLKAMANDARKASVNVTPRPYSPSAKAAYATEVASLNAKLQIAQRNRPLERQAQVLANALVTQKRQANPDMEKADLKKIKAQALEEARTRTGAGKHRIEITKPEWDAIQSGAVSNHQLTEILKNSDLDQVKQLATPRTTVLMTGAKTARATSMLNQGYSQGEIAKALGVSLSTLKTTLNEGG